VKSKLLSGIIGIIFALFLGAIIMGLQGYAPLQTYAALFHYSVGSWYSFATMLRNSVPLILTGLSASMAFASGPVNLGQPGQFLIGALLTTVTGMYIDLPPIWMIPLLIFFAMLGGAIWSGLAAALRLRFSMSEFITTLMLNMIADFFTFWAISFPFFDPEAYSPMTPPIHTSGWLIEWGDFNPNILIMLITVVVIWFISRKTVVGYEWRMGGQNSLFARLGGCDMDKNYLRVMLLTGALAGLAGGLIVMAGPHRFIKGLGANYAWDGIMIAMVANNDIVETFLYGLFFSILQTGAIGMELITAVPREFIMVIQAVIVLVVVAGRSVFTILANKLAVRKKTKEGLS